ncbi:MAG: ImmA/IrrE family metallo-endopeptidase [Acidimicrobiales bacterium]|nr:ImmA/IrrE family metallo-endopeptidase [Acidimicrobiales bacterium]
MTKSLITHVRDLVPLRSLRPVEAYRLAELQADTLLKVLDITEPPVPVEFVADLPKVQVRYVAHWPSSGMTRWTHATWTVVINSSEPAVRQRFSLGHELKHILDDRFKDIIYPNDGPMSEERLQESVCDYFSGCLLVPKRWLRQAWTEGLQNSFLLARHFDVSEPAIQVRLSQIGLTEPVDRHGQPRSRAYFRLGATATQSWEVA